MEFLVPLMPMFVLLPPAVAGAWIVHRILRHREHSLRASDDMEALRETQQELQERLDVTERILAQVRESQRQLPGAD